MADVLIMKRTIARGARLGVVLLGGATLLCAGSLTEECRKTDKQPAKSVCEVNLGRSDTWLVDQDLPTTWNRSGSFFGPRYSALLTSTEKPVAKIEDNLLIITTSDPVAINLND